MVIKNTPRHQARGVPLIGSFYLLFTGFGINVIAFNSKLRHML